MTTSRPTALTAARTMTAKMGINAAALFYGDNYQNSIGRGNEKAARYHAAVYVAICRLAKKAHTPGTVTVAI